MRRSFSAMLVFGLLGSTLFANSHDYNNGNGTILEQTKINGLTWEIRKHIQEVKVGDAAGAASMVVYDDHTLQSKVVGNLTIGQEVKTSQIARATIDGIYNVWIKLTTDNHVQGWIFFGGYSSESAQFCDPYFDNRWEIVGRVIGGRTWTIRKMVYQHVAIWEVVNIRVTHTDFRGQWRLIRGDWRDEGTKAIQR